MTTQTTITDGEARRYALILDRLAEEHGEDTTQRMADTLNEADRLYGPGSAAYIADLSKRDHAEGIAGLIDPDNPYFYEAIQFDDGKWGVLESEVTTGAGSIAEYDSQEAAEEAAKRMNQSPE